LYALYKANACHGDTDDCAICCANTIEEANKIFSHLYDISCYKGCIEELRFNDYGIGILGDY